MKKKLILSITGGILSVFILGLGVVVAAFYSSPGTPLYGLSGGIQALVINSQSDPVSKATTAMTIADGAVTGASATALHDSTVAQQFAANIINSDTAAITQLKTVTNPTLKSQLAQVVSSSLTYQLKQVSGATDLAQVAPSTTATVTTFINNQLQTIPTPVQGTITPKPSAAPCPTKSILPCVTVTPPKTDTCIQLPPCAYSGTYRCMIAVIKGGDFCPVPSVTTTASVTPTGPKPL